MTLAADLKSVGDGRDLDVAVMKEEQFTVIQGTWGMGSALTALRRTHANAYWMFNGRVFESSAPPRFKSARSLDILTF